MTIYFDFIFIMILSVWKTEIITKYNLPLRFYQLTNRPINELCVHLVFLTPISYHTIIIDLPPWLSKITCVLQMSLLLLYGNRSPTNHHQSTNHINCFTLVSYSVFYDAYMCVCFWFVLWVVIGCILIVFPFIFSYFAVQHFIIIR